VSQAVVLVSVASMPRTTDPNDEKNRLVGDVFFERV
jgi:hypothetical protein